MKRCGLCGTAWEGYGNQPRTREVCEGCGGYLHCCRNCHHYDESNSRCGLPDTEYVGGRESLNYCEDFRIIDDGARAHERKVTQAKAAWEELFRR